MLHLGLYKEFNVKIFVSALSILGLVIVAAFAIFAEALTEAGVLFFATVIAGLGGYSANQASK